MNWLMDTDSYKFSHPPLYPKGMNYMMSYLEARGGDFPETSFFGLQYILKRYLSKRITMDDILYAQRFLKKHGVPFDYDGWRHIAVNCGGYLPVKISAVEEGTVVPTSNVLMTVESTDPRVAWVVSHIEDILVRLWYPITVATLSRTIKELIFKYLINTSDNAVDEIPFKLHDFGSRGVSSQESAAIGGGSHLMNFMGSDTIAGIEFIRNYYSYKDQMPAFSIPASEHSTITSWGEKNEYDAYKNLVDVYKDTPLYACVSDSYDLDGALKMWGALKASMGKGMLVVRPDSGDPVINVTKTLIELEKSFGVTKNSKGYKVLNKVRVIQGDGVNFNSINSILHNITKEGFSAANVAFGMGGGLLQKIDRDTISFAYKCCAIKVGDEVRRVYKRAPGKSSKAGLLGLVKEEHRYITKENVDSKDNLLKPVFLDGRLLSNITIDEVRTNAKLAHKDRLTGWVDHKL